MCGLLETLWGFHQVVPRHNGFHGPSFLATRDTTQGVIMSPTLFNVVVDNVIITWMAMTVEYQRVVQDGLGKTVGQCGGVLYSCNCMVISSKPDWLQHAMNALVGLFRSYGLAANFTKSLTITCHPRALRLGMSDEAMALKCARVRDSYRVIIQRRIPCP